MPPPFLPRLLWALLFILAIRVLAATPALGQTPAITSLGPVRHATAAPLAGNVAVTFSELMGLVPASSLRVFSSQAGGRKAGALTVTGNTLSFDPATDFKPGEVVSVTVT
ncbi:MAG TPA: Ig-like domain-containing protein, partial [bacterium]|nr:Ig-like domain-containing protein [bacterium]